MTESLRHPKVELWNYTTMRFWLSDTNVKVRLLPTKPETQIPLWEGMSIMFHIIHELLIIYGRTVLVI
jgi:hypothetical protein